MPEEIPGVQAITWYLFLALQAILVYLAKQALGSIKDVEKKVIILIGESINNKKDIDFLKTECFSFRESSHNLRNDLTRKIGEVEIDLDKRVSKIEYSIGTKQ